MQQSTFYLENREHIALCDLLKLTGLCGSGGEAKAKALVAAGAVLRNGETEMRKTAKIRSGETVSLHSITLNIRAADERAADEPAA